MIKCYFGKMRQGKTYLMTKDVIDLLNKGEVVYTNYKINWSGHKDLTWWRVFIHKLGIYKIKIYPLTNLRFFKDWQDVYDVRECTIALDEGWLYFNSYVRLPIDQQRRLMQSGKRRMDFLYTTQRPLQTDINLRWNTDVFIEAQRIDIPFIKRPLFVYRWYDLKEDDSNAIIEKVREVSHKDGTFETIDQSLKTGFNLASKKIFNAYDTEYEIYESEKAREQISKRQQEDVSSRAPTISTIPTFWNDFNNLIKYGNRQPTRRKNKLRKRKKRIVLRGTDRRGTFINSGVANRASNSRVVNDIVVIKKV